MTFCLSDIEGSTTLWEGDPAAMAEALVRHDEIIAAQVEAHGGRFLKSMGEGDSTVSVFESAAEALGALGDPGAADALADAALARPARVAAAAVDALGALPQAPEVAAALCRVALATGEADVAARAAREVSLRESECPERPLLARLAQHGSAAVAALAAVSPQGIHDPRSITYTAALGSESAVAAPARYLRARVGERDVLYPYSSVFLAALPEAGRAHGLPRGQSQSLLAALGRLDYPVQQIFVAVPKGTADFGRAEVVGEIPFESWLLVRRMGPFGGEAAVLEAIRAPLADLRAAAVAPLPAPLAAWFGLNESVLCKSLSETAAGCGTQ
jgi:hypothetical protein